MTLKYLRQSWFFFSANFSTLAKINLPFIFAFNLLISQVDLTPSEDNPGDFANTLLLLSGLNLLLMPIYWGATISFMQSTITGPTYTVSQSLAASLKLWPKLFSVFLLTSCCIFFGFMAFIIPGIYVAIRLSISDYLCVVEQKSPVQSLKSSWQLTAQYSWPIFQGIALILAVIFLLKTLLLSVFESVLSELSFLNPVINSLFDLLNVLVMIYGFRIYCLIKEEL
ncbi:MAG: hypothetical protein HRU06_11015 [Oceanospirillaceae bacterium]|nr:hypothetical protein [Oceanospirillaceae bacterium]